MTRNALEIITDAGARAWQRGLFAGFNGNISMRGSGKDNTTGLCLCTCTRVCKGALRPESFCVLNLTDGSLISGGKPSTENAVHLEIYRKQASAQAIIHCHPPKLLALSLIDDQLTALKIPLYESARLLSSFAIVPPIEPGSAALGTTVGSASLYAEAIWMSLHGLVCWGKNMEHALALCEELENLAHICMLSLKEKHPSHE